MTEQLLLAVAAALLVAALLTLRTRESAWAAWGLLLVPALASGVLVGGGRALGLVPGWTRVRAFAEREGAARRLSLAVVWGLGSWLLGGAVALWVLQQEISPPRRAGALLALAAVATILAVSALTELLSRAVLSFEAAARWRARVGGLRFLLPALLLALGVGLPIVLGETAGRGHVLALMGVFRRPELDLRPVLELLSLVLGALVLGALPVRARSVLAVIGLGLIGLAAWAAVSSRDLDLRQATHITRQGGLARAMLGVHTRLSDGDGDGFAAHYGGGDCDDRDPQVFPGAVDLPGNGRDEDCDGSDAPASVPDPATPPGSAPHATPPGSPPGASARPWPSLANVLLLTVDTLRFDLGYMRPGGGGRLSPRLDELAARCTVFERAYSLASYTSKSLGPMMIGKYSSEVARTFEHFDRFGKAESFLQERIQAAGHRTLSVQAYWYFFLKGYGFERGFDQLDKEAAPKLIAVDGDASVTGEKVADRTVQALMALDAHPGRFFAWAHWVDPHSEYVPHPEFDLGSSSRQRYDGEVAYVDHQLGRVLDALAERPFAERTAILVTSDHGEAFGEHGMIRHGFEVWEELVRVPLLLCVPGSPARRVAVPRSLIDLAPTVLELLDVETKPGELRGVSLLRDVTAAEPERRPVLVDMPRGPNNQERRAFIHGNHKLITSAGRVLGLYDLSTDPAETTDLSANKGLVESLQAELKAYLSTLKMRPPG